MYFQIIFKKSLRLYFLKEDEILQYLARFWGESPNPAQDLQGQDDLAPLTFNTIFSFLASLHVELYLAPWICYGWLFT